MVGVGGEGQLGHALGASGRALDLELVVHPLQVVDAALEQMRRQMGAFSRILRAAMAVAAPAVGVRATGVRAQAVRRGIGVAVLDVDVLDGQAKLLGDDLGERRLVPLTLGSAPRCARSPSQSDGSESRRCRTS